MLRFRVVKRFPGFELDVAVATESPVLVILAPSGSGKTLLLDGLAGLVPPDRGYLDVQGERLFDTEARFSVPLRLRGLGYVVQDYALFPHKSVRDNIAFGMHPPDEAELARLVLLFGLESIALHRPEEISGGQRQRTALARALAARPRLLLLDEPFAAIDEAQREELLDETLRRREEWGIPMIFVTHNTSEARRIGGDLLILSDGRVVEHGDAGRVFTHPQTAFAARFLGKRNLFPAKVERVEGGQCALDTPLGRVLAASDTRFPEGAQAAFFLDPLELRVRRDERPAENNWRGEVVRLYPSQRLFRAHVALEAGEELVIDLEPHACMQGQAAPGRTLDLLIAPEHVRLCQPDS